MSDFRDGCAHRHQAGVAAKNRAERALHGGNLAACEGHFVIRKDRYPAWIERRNPLRIRPERHDAVGDAAHRRHQEHDERKIDQCAVDARYQQRQQGVTSRKLPKRLFQSHFRQGELDLGTQGERAAIRYQEDTAAIRHQGGHGSPQPSDPAFLAKVDL